MKQMLSGWWDQVRMREGWSDKIGKWQWVTLQVIIPILVVSPLLVWMTTTFEDYTLTHVLTFMILFFPLSALSFSGRWDKDQSAMGEYRGEK